MSFATNGNGKGNGAGVLRSGGLRARLADGARHPDDQRHHQRAAGPGRGGPDHPAGLPRAGHRGPDPLLRAEAGAVRRLPHLRGRGRGAGATRPISCGTQIAEGMVITTHSERLIENRRMVLELIFSDHDAYCLPPCQFKCPTRVDIPGYLKQNTPGQLGGGDAHPEALAPVPRHPGPRLPRAVRDALPARGGRHRHRHPRFASLLRGPRAGGGCAGAHPVAEGPGHRAPGGGHRRRPGRHGGGLLPAAARPSLRRLRGRSGAGRHAALRDPGVPPAEGLDGPRAEPRLGAGRHLPAEHAPRPRLPRSPTCWTRATTRSTSASAATSRTSWASPARTPTAWSTPWRTSTTAPAACRSRR